MPEYPFIPYRPQRLDESEQLRRAKEFYQEMEARRSVRFFSSQPVPRQLIEYAIRTASSAPSGAHRQPWKFVAVDDAATKRRIRIEVEREEKTSYQKRMPDEWLKALQPLGTSWQKPYLETVPWIVVAFAESYGLSETGSKQKNYYVQESVGIACGFLIAALHHMGLSTLTHTPSPMGFLRSVLGRPKNEKPYILFPIGYAAPDATVPSLNRKPFQEVAVWNPDPASGTES